MDSEQRNSAFKKRLELLKDELNSLELIAQANMETLYPWFRPGRLRGP